MKLLADMGISGTTVAELQRHGHDAVHLRDRGLKRLPDDEVLGLARLERRVVLTFDLDFGDLLAASSAPLPSVILFRLHDQTPASVTPRALEVLSQRDGELMEGAIIIVEEHRYRLRRLPIRRTSQPAAG